MLVKEIQILNDSNDAKSTYKLIRKFTRHSKVEFTIKEISLFHFLTVSY